jgi:hypothetical protein
MKIPIVSMVLAIVAVYPLKIENTAISELDDRFIKKQISSDFRPRRIENKHINYELIESIIFYHSRGRAKGGFSLSVDSLASHDGDMRYTGKSEATKLTYLFRRSRFGQLAAYRIL